MAKRYIRINWQDKPSTATPLSAEFLNKMDKGIDDCDNAIETLDENKINKANIANNLVTTSEGLVLDARQGKILKGLIDEQNNNLAKLTTVYINDTSKDVDTLVREYFTSMPDVSKRSLVIRPSGANCFAEVYKFSNTYGAYLLITPNTSIKFNSYTGSTWSTKTITIS